MFSRNEHVLNRPYIAIIMAEKVYLYQLVEFIAEKTKGGKSSIDCVPTKWIEFDMIIGQCFAKFMPPPYTIERKRELKQMVVDTDDAPLDWPRYAVTIRGGAGAFHNIFFYSYT
ncbi:PREDICTED: uncharacterized protein LOC105560970 [Vollenhovia emeryi]|uniref:uncharacterized protein LOC105560970 n=1 Tax=Vollenhovia emeryi TaxID=411798 RepID=UPI0005F422B0|nr:PREDICTED: uncharacterized protein LOC105560970 [Vollenhovia emeryi]